MAVCDVCGGGMQDPEGAKGPNGTEFIGDGGSKPELAGKLE